ncbi:hypothetical protein SETIT_8G246500v2 [Setaria italica]|uniref:DUF1618 domain-containing protein n=1 Tax=Setaria italica TaxID=4555 RepID=K3ZI85_SETIT|nr:uncharacterized protein LOC101760111 [Setaria italica]RCV39726.1 hypothetical protein SETIT_8G246500v2 [Setaria italica]
MDPFPSIPARPSWIILDRFIHRTDRDVEDEADGTASEISYTCTDRPIRASIRVADSPAVSRLYLDWPSRAEFEGRLREPCVIAADNHSILFTAIVPLEDPMCCKDTASFPVDMFVYSAFSSPPSLHRLRTCFTGGVSNPDEDIYFKPYQRCQQRIMAEKHTGLLCHGSKGGFTVVDFTNFGLEGELCLLHHPALPASASHKNTEKEEADWMIKKVRLPPGPRVRRWITDAIIPLHGRYLCWVDNYQGILVVDVLRASDKNTTDELLLHYIPLPHEALQSDRSHPDGDCPDKARCVCVTADFTLKLVCVTTGKANRARSPFTIRSWTFPWKFPHVFPSGRWYRGHTMEAAEFWGLYNGQSLPRVKPMYPLVSLVNPAEFCFLLNEDHTTYWIIKVNMGKKMLKSSAIYINEEEEGCTTDRPRARRIIFDGHSFIPSGISYYLGMDDAIKSRELSEMMQKAKQCRVAQKKGQLEVEQAESKAAKCRA